MESFLKTNQRIRALFVVLKYLRTQGCLKSIREQSACHSVTDYGVMSIVIEVDLMQLAEIDCDIANFLSRRPQDGTMIFRELVHEILVSKGLLPDNGDMSQLAVTLRISAATLPGLSWLGNHRGRYTGLVKMNAIIIGVTSTVTYTKSTKYACASEACAGHNDNQYVRIHIPGASEQEIVGKEFRCSGCGSRLKEVKSQRSLSDKLLAEVMVVKPGAGQDLFTPSNHQQTVAVIIRDDLCQRVRLGQQYEIIGTQRVQVKPDCSVIAMFEANNLIPLVKEAREEKPMEKLSHKLQQTYLKWSKTSAVFPHLMAFKFAAAVCPPNCFFKLKLLMLISLVLALTDEDPLLHLVAVSSESELVQRLLEHAGRLAARTVTHTSLHVLGARVGAGHYAWAPYFVQAGSLVLSSGGVCKAGNLKSLKKASSEQLQTALTERRLDVALEARYTGGLPQVLPLPLTCQVWAQVTVSPSARQGDSTLGSASFCYGAGVNIAHVSPALLDAFSIVCHCDLSLCSSTDVSEDLASHLLQSSMTREQGTTAGSSCEESAESSNISFEDFQKYIQVCRGCRSVMTVEAEWLLTSYLIAARHARAQNALSVHGNAVPLSAWGTLQALSHGLCRLSLRQAVTEADAVVAIALYEEALTARHGVSALNVFPEPHLPAASAETYLTTELVPQMRKFHSRLLSFVAGSGSTGFTEE